MDLTSIKKLYEWFEKLIELSPEQEARELQALREQKESLVLHLECLLASARKNTSTSVAFGIEDLLDAAKQTESDDLSSDIEQLSNELRCDPVQPFYRVGDFLLQRCLSLSKLGITYYAHDTVLDRDVVLMLAMPRWRSTPALRNRLVESSRIVAKLFHPNVASILGAMDADGQFLIIRQWIPGVSLDEALNREGPFSMSNTIQTAIGICKGLQALHQADVLHGDLKPANIILHKDSSDPVITDFGTSLWLASPNNPVWKGGTPGYIAPEILRGENSSKSADLFSLGVILDQLQHSTLRQPSQIRSEFQEHSGPLTSNFRSQSPQAQLDTLIRDLVKESPTDRPESIDAVLAGLRTMFSGINVDSEKSHASSIPEHNHAHQPSKRLVTRRSWLRRTINHGILGTASSAVAFQFAQSWLSEPPVLSPYVPGIETNHKLFFQLDPTKIPSDSCREHRLSPTELYDAEFFGISPTIADQWLHLETGPRVLPAFDIKANLITLVCRFDIPAHHAKVQLAYRYSQQAAWATILSARNTYGGLYFKHYHLSLANHHYRKDQSIQFRISMFRKSTTAERIGAIPLSISTSQMKTENAVVQLLLWDRLMYKSDRSDKVQV